MSEKKTTPSTVQEYIAAAPAELRARLDTVRQTILAAAPESKESISYGMAGYKLHGKPLIYFACQTRHIGLYPGTEAITIFKDKLTGFRCTKGGIQCPHAKEFPYGLLQDLVEYRVGLCKKDPAKKQR